MRSGGSISRWFAALSFVVAPVVHAQSASTTATATVDVAMAISGTADLAFGTVMPGIAKTIGWDAATSGRLSVAGSGNAQIAMTFLLPPVLTSGGSSMLIGNFNVHVNQNATTNNTDVLTVTSGVPALSNLRGGKLFVFIGGRVDPAGTQPGGTYTGTITLAVAYTGL